MEEVGGEHHVVAREPELRVILGVEPVDVASADESKPVEDHHAAEEVDKDARVVKGTILNADDLLKTGRIIRYPSAGRS